MKLLILRSYFDPEIAASMYLINNLIEDFVGNGFEVEIHTPQPTRGVTKEVFKQYKNDRFEVRHSGKVKIFRFPMVREGKSTFSRAIRYLLCSLVYLYEGLLVKNFDILFIASTPPTMGVIGGLVRKIRRIPVVYSLQDIFPDSLISTGISYRGSILWNFGRIIENFTYRNVDCIIVPSKSFKSNLIEKKVQVEKIKVIYNWVDEKSVYPVNKNDNTLFEKFGIDRQKFIITYSGNFGLTQNLNMILEIAKDLEVFKDILFVLIGNGVLEDEIKKIVIKNKIENVKIFPFQDYSDISNVFSLGDVGLVISKANVGNNSIPSKTWSIMAAGRPVLASFDVDSELCSIVNDAKCGVCVPPDDFESLKREIIYLSKNPDISQELGNNGRNFIVSQLSRKESTSQYIQVINLIYKNRYLSSVSN